MSAAAPALPRAPLEAAGLPARVVDGCVAHFALLVRWNRTHNLTRITDPGEAAVRHYLDSVLPVWLHRAETLGANRTQAEAWTPWMDIGSGAGFPGLVAALLDPALPVVLVEPSRKRASFLRVAAGELGLAHVRVETPEAARGHTSPWVMSRATFSAGARTELWPYVAPGGELWAWSTTTEQAAWEDEVATWPEASATRLPYTLPGLGERCIVRLRRRPQTLDTR
jgi:16S rRNA (guanine527-N7)-methyltransferase